MHIWKTSQYFGNTYYVPGIFTYSNSFYSDVLTLSCYNWEVDYQRGLQYDKFTQLENVYYNFRAWFSCSYHTAAYGSYAIYCLFSLYLLIHYKLHFWHLLLAGQVEGYKNEKHDSWLHGKHNLGEGIRQVNKKAR